MNDSPSTTPALSSWYASWADESAPERYTDSSYTLSPAAWDRLKVLSRLWYRVCTSTDASSWDGYEPSTLDDGLGVARREDLGRKLR